MQTVKILSTGEIRKVSNNEAHSLIDRQIAELVSSYSTKPMEGAGVLEPQKLRQSSSNRGDKPKLPKGIYLTK